jgi:hypothetical protein
MPSKHRIEQLMKASSTSGHALAFQDTVTFSRGILLSLNIFFHDIIKLFQGHILIDLQKVHAYCIFLGQMAAF